MIEKLTIQVSKTADGKQDYVQVMHGDMMTVNIVLIAAQVIIHDDRKKVK